MKNAIKKVRFIKLFFINKKPRGLTPGENKQWTVII